MEQSKPKLTLLWHSVSPFIESGYGRVTRHLTTRFGEAGYRVLISAYYGVEPGGILSYSKNVFVLASKEGQFGIISAAKYAKQFNVDVSFLMTDWWAFSDFPKICPNPILYGPMDHENYPEEIVNFTKMYWKIVPLCWWQYNMLKEQMGIEPEEPIYHGVDINIYKPLDKQAIKKKNGLEDKFVFGSVNANSDKEMGGGRKSWGPMMKAMRYFLDNNPDVKEDEIVWLIHTNPTDPRGYPLLGMAHKYKLDNICKFAHPDIQSTALSDQQMAELYNSFDVFLGCSKREGFGMTFLEAMSCGIPVIAHDFSSLTELVKGHGWLVKSVARDLNMELTPILADTAIPDVYDIADKIKEAYFREDLRKKYGKESRQFAIQYNWDDLVKYKWLPLLEESEEEIKLLKEAGL
jgi:glycosyltransferase involved in cell wall biosynthesis